MNLLDSKLKRLIPVTDKERTCLSERNRQAAKREWMKQNIIERLASVDDGMVINVRVLTPSQLEQIRLGEEYWKDKDPRMYISW